MPVFAVISTKEPQKLTASVTEKIPDGDRYKLTSDSWLVSFPGTTTQLTESIGISDGTAGSAVVLAVGNYFGRANPDIWEWLKLHFPGTAA
jgi:hypothetical protein